MGKAKDASGLYTSASDIVREALRLMEQQDQLRSLKLQQLRQGIQEGLDSGPPPPRPREASRPGKRPHHHAVDRLINRSLYCSMQAISANEFKTGGVGAIARALEQDREVGVSVRGDLFAIW